MIRYLRHLLQRLGRHGSHKYLRFTNGQQRYAVQIPKTPTLLIFCTDNQADLLTLTGAANVVLENNSVHLESDTDVHDRRSNFIAGPGLLDNIPTNFVSSRRNEEDKQNMD